MMDESALDTLASTVPSLLGAFGINPDMPNNPSPIAAAKIANPTPAQPANPLANVVQSLESGGRDYDKTGQPLTSSAGAQYAMQTMPSTQRDPGFGVTPAQDGSAAEADRVGRDYLAAMKQRYGNDAMAMAAYNAGPGALDHAIAKGGDQWLSQLPAETQAYVANGAAKLAQPTTAQNISTQGQQYAQADTGTQADASQANTINVELPDGTVVQGVPANITKADLMAKLQANGHSLGGADAGRDGNDGKPSFIDNSIKNYKAGFQDVKDILSGNYEGIGKSSPTPKTQKLADALFPSGSDGSVSSALGNLSKLNPSDVTGPLLEKFGDSLPGKALGAIGDTVFNPATTTINDYANPAIAKATGINPDNLSAIEMLAGLKIPKIAPELGDAFTAGSKVVGKAAGKIPGADLVGKLAADESGSGAPVMSGGKTQEIAPQDFHSAIADTYAKQKDLSGQAYDAAATLGDNIKAPDAQSLASGLQGTIDDIKSSPFHEATAALPKLQNYLAKIKSKTTDGQSSILDASGNPIPKPAAGLSVSDLVDLKKTLNSNFNPKRFVDAKGTAYGDLSGSVGASLEKAAQQNPVFGKAYTLAKQQWLNNVEQPFQNNPVLAKFFKPEDYHAMNSVDSGLAERLPDATQARASSLVQNVKTQAQLDALRRVLPPELQGALAKQVAKGVNTNLSRLNAAKNTVFQAADLRPRGIANTVGNIADVVTGPKLKPQTADLIKATKSKSPNLTDYSSQIQALKDLLQTP